MRATALAHPQPDDAPSAAIGALSAHLQSPVAVFDLETTTVFGNSGLGILEYGIIVFDEQGRSWRFHGLCNPEADIDPEVQAVTGISPERARMAPIWPESGAKLFAELAENALFVGFGIAAHDIPALHEQAHRYRLPIPAFRRRLDLSVWHKRIHGKWASLIDAAEAYGARPRGRAHQALTDAALAAELLERMLFFHGVDGFLPAPGKPRSREKNPLSIEHDRVYAVAAFLGKHSYTGPGPIADALGISDYEAGRALLEGIRDAVILPETVTLPTIGRWLDAVLPETVDAEWVRSGRRLKPLLGKLVCRRDCPDGLDYVQLQAGLRRLRL